MKRNKNFKLNNVSVASWGHCESYNSNRHSPEFEEVIKPYVENDCLKTDIKSLSAVAKILDEYTGELLGINDDGTFTFFDANY